MRRISDEHYRKIHDQDIRLELEGLIFRKEYAVMGNSTTVCLLKLKNGIEVVGKSQLVDYALFNPEIGKTCAYEDALSQLRQLWGCVKLMKKSD